jgi:prolycopene isomerase
MGQLADTLVENFTKMGGEIRYNTPVDQVIVREGAAAGVSTKLGETFRAKRVIHAGDHRELVAKMIPPTAVTERWRRGVLKTPVSDTLFTVYLGVDIPASRVRSLLGAYHVFVQPGSTPLPNSDVGDLDADPDLHARRWVEVTAPNSVDQGTIESGQSSLILQCLSRYGWQERWGSAPGGEPTPEYRSLKQRVARQLIATAEKVIPGLAEHILLCDAATPLTKARRTRNSEGATAGWTWDPRSNPIRGTLGRYRTPVRGLFQVGHWTARIGGVPAAVLSAKVVADIVAKELKR